MDGGQHSQETRLALAEQAHALHEKQCDERAGRVADDIGRIRGAMEREQTERRDAVARIHNRIDQVHIDMTETKAVVVAIQAAVKEMPAMIAEQINVKVDNASTRAKNWAYSKTIAGVLALAGLAVAIWQAIKGN